MATKIELEAELAALRSERSQWGDQKRNAAAQGQPEPDGAKTPDLPNPESGEGSGDADFEKPVENEDLWEQLFQELEGLPQRNLLLATAGALAIGFILGRISK